MAGVKGRDGVPGGGSKAEEVAARTGRACLEPREVSEQLARKVGGAGWVGCLSRRESEADALRERGQSVPIASDSARTEAIECPGEMEGRKGGGGGGLVLGASGESVPWLGGKQGGGQRGEQGERAGLAPRQGDLKQGGLRLRLRGASCGGPGALRPVISPGLVSGLCRPVGSKSGASSPGKTPKQPGVRLGFRGAGA